MEHSDAFSEFPLWLVLLFLVRSPDIFVNSTLYIKAVPPLSQLLLFPKPLFHLPHMTTTNSLFSLVSEIATAPCIPLSAIAVHGYCLASPLSQPNNLSGITG